MKPIEFSDPNPNRVEEAVLILFRAYALEFQSRRREWTAQAYHCFTGSIGSVTESAGPDTFDSVVNFEIMCRRKCCTFRGGAPDHLVHSISITCEFGINEKYPKYWRVFGGVGNFDPDMDETPIESFLADVQFNVEQPDEVYLEQVKKKLDELPLVLDYVSKDTTRWTKREY